MGGATLQEAFFRNPLRASVFVWWGLVFSCWPTWGDRVTLKDGLVLEGTIIASPFQLAIRTPLKTYLVPTELLLHPEGSSSENELPESYAFDVAPPKNAKRLVSVGKVLSAEPFDAFGRRNVTLEMGEGKKIVVTQAIAELYPTHALAHGLNYSWTTALALSEIPPAELAGMLERLTPANDFADQMKRASFLIEAGNFKNAQAQLTLLAERFPNESSRRAELEAKWLEHFSREGQRVCARALAAFQPKKAKQILDEFARLRARLPDASAWDVLQKEYDDAQMKIRRGKELLEGACAEVETSKLRALGEEILADLRSSSVDRIEPLVSFGESATPTERMALAVTGWLAGKDLATPDAGKAGELLRTRELLLAALRARDEADFEIALDEAKGVSPAVAQVLLPRLPAPLAGHEPGEVFELTTEGTTVLAQLPSEYSAIGKHPLVIALHGVRNSAEEELEYWRPIAEELGAVLLAPKAISGEKSAYTYSLEEHRRVLSILADARLRYAIDADRVFLVGHEVGAFAVFDLGMSHPDEWAGIVPIGGLPMFYAQYYWRNVKSLPIFAVDGALNGDNPAILRGHLERWFKQGTPMVYAEFAGRGTGSFEVERPMITDWMRRQRRNPFPKEVEGASARHSDTRFYWLEIDGFMENATVPPELFDKKKNVRAARIKGELTDTGSLSIQANGITSLLVHLSAPLVSIDDDAFTVKVNGKVAHRGKVEPDLGTMLRAVRRTGDRQRLVMQTLRVTP